MYFKQTISFVRLILPGIFLQISTVLFSQNPICPEGIYFADPSAHVWENGKLYLYGSLDESKDYYCSRKHVVMETSDMKTWTVHDNSFFSAGKNDQVPYNDELLYAPDCAFRNDTFFLYYCQPDRKNAEGVAYSLKPEGPFINGQALNLPDFQEIDPSLFIDDDGQAYYLWGQFSLKMAKMGDNMRDLEFSSFKDSIITESAHYFHEGAFLTKRNGMYYLVYADISRSGMPTCIGYSTATNPFGPYTYGGVIIDNDNCDPGNWNNHGSIVEFNKTWYVFYHRATHGSTMMRRACVEPISFLADGSIPEVEMTSQGAGGPLKASKKIEAEYACLLHGNIQVNSDAKQKLFLTNIKSGDKAAFKYIDFENGVKKITIRYLPGSQGSSVTLGIDNPWQNQIASIQIAPKTQRKEWTTQTFDVSSVTGIHTLWLQFWGDQGERVSIDWFFFE